MSKAIQFHQKNGLTPYALACGHIQRAARVIGADYELRVDLWHEGACFHVRAHEHGGRGRLSWDSTHSLTEARKAWAETVKLHFGDRLGAVKADKRFSVAQEYTGERDPYWVARIEGAPRDSWIGKSATVEGAWLLAADKRDQLAGAQ